MDLNLLRATIKSNPEVIQYLKGKARKIADEMAMKGADERAQVEGEMYQKIVDIFAKQQERIARTGREDPTYLQAELKKAVTDYLQAAALAGVEAAAASVGIGFDPTAFDVKISDWIQSYSFDLIKGINDTTRGIVQDALTKFNQTAGMTNKDLFDLLTPAFGDARAQMIAITEVTRAYSESNSMYQDYMTELGVESMREWHTSKDEKVCPICSPMDMQQAKQDEKFKDDFGNEYDNPPAHVNCRCSGEIRVKV